MDMDSFRRFVDWAYKNIWMAILVCLLGCFLYGGYSFVGGYASKFGESFAGNYSRFKLSIASYTVIDTLLHNYLIEYNASRISIGRFHNSVKDIADNAMFFVTFESSIASPGVTLDFNYKDIPATTYSMVLPSLLDTKPLMLWTKDLPDVPLKELLVQNGTKAALFVPIRDLNDRLIGMITVSWINTSDIPKVQGSMDTALGQAAIRIGAYLSAKE